MANIWPVYEGREPTIGGPWASLPLSEAIALFELRPQHFVSELTTTPRFGDADRNLTHAGYRHVVVEVGRGEAQLDKWKPGFYRSRISPKEAYRRLIQQALVAKLGEANVVRVEYEPTVDSQGREALKITVVIAPGATQRLRKVVLDGLVSLRMRLNEMGDTRTPIVEYATEAELVEDGSPQS
jgi:hypothetical protein